MVINKVVGASRPRKSRIWPRLGVTWGIGRGGPHIGIGANVRHVLFYIATGKVRFIAAGRVPHVFKMEGRARVYTNECLSVIYRDGPVDGSSDGKNHRRTDRSGELHVVLSAARGDTNKRN